MKKTTLLQIGLVSCLILIASNIKAKPIENKSTLQQATVFFEGAELIHKANASLQKGSNEVWISNLSPSIDINSLKIKTTKGVIVASYEYSQDYVNKKQVGSLEKTLKDSITFYKNKINEYAISKQTNNDLLDLLKANKSIGGSQTGLSVSELTKMVEYYKVQSNTLNKEQNELTEKTDEAKKALERLEQQLWQESTKNVKSEGVLKLNLTSPLATNTEFTITYFTANANWVPYYDVNVPNMDEKVQIASKAKVAQTTGLDWTNVKLALSTATPSKNKVAPLFNAWFLDFYQAPDYSRRANKNLARQNAYAPSGVMLEESVSNAYAIRGAGSSTKDTTPLYIINGEVATAEEVAQLDSDLILSTEVIKDASAQALYGSRANDGVIVIKTKTLDDFVSREEGELNAVFNIDLPYTILGNGKIQNIDLQTTAVAAQFKHYAVPKLDTDVFILAEISDWQKLGLLSGKANITFDGTYVGETLINTASVSSTLTLTLGSDKRVTVKREKLQDYSSRKFLGKDTQQDFTYKITAKNNQNKAIKLVLKDQYPLTNQKDIQVELLKETSPATYTNEEIGVLNWVLDLEPGASKELKIAYRVKYPKDNKPTNL